MKPDIFHPINIPQLLGVATYTMWSPISNSLSVAGKIIYVSRAVESVLLKGINYPVNLQSTNSYLPAMRQG